MIMKKALANICGPGCLASLVIAGAENLDGSCNLAWTLGFLTLAAVLGWAYGKLNGTEGRANG